jgi:hypothetical protein
MSQDGRMERMARSTRAIHVRSITAIVEAKRSREHPERTLFWGATRHDRWIFVACEDWTEDSVRYLKPITAFEPEEGEAYWRRQ